MPDETKTAGVRRDGHPLSLLIYSLLQLEFLADIFGDGILVDHD